MLEESKRERHNGKKEGRTIQGKTEIHVAATSVHT